MAQVDSHDPDLLIFKSGGGCLMIFGLPFLIAGIAVMTSPFWDPKNAPWYFMVPFGAIFATIGVAMIFGRAGVSIDKRMGQVNQWWGLLFPLKTNLYNLADIQQVSISKKIRRSKNSSYTVYPVCLKGATVQIDIEEPQAYGEARRCAENLAKFTGLPLADSTSGQEVIRDPDRLDESIREKVRRTGAREIPSAPANMKTSYSIDGQEIQLDIPPSGWHPIFFIPILLGLGIAAFIYFSAVHGLLHDSKAPLPFKLFGGLFIILPLIGVVMPALKLATRRYTVLVSPQKLTLESRWALGKSIQTMAAEEIEELQLSQGPLPEEAKETPVPKILFEIMGSGNILVRSDKTTLTFGKGLDRQELEWLLALIENTISA